MIYNFVILFLSKWCLLSFCLTDIFFHQTRDLSHGPICQFYPSGVIYSFVWTDTFFHQTNKSITCYWISISFSPDMCYWSITIHCCQYSTCNHCVRNIFILNWQILTVYWQYILKFQKFKGQFLFQTGTFYWLLNFIL